MPKIKELLGLTVIDLSTGKQIGEVKDVVIDIVYRRMVGLLLHSAGWFHSGKVILLERISNISIDSIAVADETGIVQYEAAPADGRILLQEGVIGKHIVTAAGKSIGTLADIHVDLDTGLLTGLEISDSVIKDLLEGRKTIPLPAMQKISDESVIVAEVMGQTREPCEEENKV